MTTTDPEHGAREWSEDPVGDLLEMRQKIIEASEKIAENIKRFYEELKSLTDVIYCLETPGWAIRNKRRYRTRRVQPNHVAAVRALRRVQQGMRRIQCDTPQNKLNVAARPEFSADKQQLSCVKAGRFLYGAGCVRSTPGAGPNPVRAALLAYSMEAGQGLFIFLNRQGNTDAEKAALTFRTRRWKSDLSVFSKPCLHGSPA